MRSRANETRRIVAFVTTCLWSLGAAAAPNGPTQAELNQSAASNDTWLMTNKSYDGHRYVGLDQINATNVAGLRPVCTFDTGEQAPSQSSPVLYDGRIYFTAAQSTFAIDARTCRQLWRHDWASQGRVVSPVNRGVEIKDGRLVRGTADGFLIAPSMEDGSEIWRYDALPAPGTPAAASWGSAAALSHGGGSFWTPVSVDRTRGVVYVPIGNPAPDFYGEVRPGENHGTNSVVALDIKSGRVVWARQFVAHDTHDYDLTQASPLLHVEVNGRPRDLVMVSGKDGYLRAVDRENGEVLYDVAISKQENSDKLATATPTHVCPGLLGGQEWSSTAFDPRRGIVITPMVDWCGMVSHDPTPPEHQTGVHYYGGKIEQDPTDQARGVLAAVDVATGHERWRFEGPAPTLANVTTTAGGVVYAGDLGGTLYAVSADNGKVLLHYPLGGSAAGGIFTYALDGKQYVAAMSGHVSVFFGGSDTTSRLTILALP